MAGEATVTVVGHVGGDPELRFTSSGTAVASFSLANTPRTKGTNGEWGDGETMWLRVTAWNKQAEAVAEEVRKGQKVIVVGRLAQKSYKTKDGEDRTSLELTADEVGVVPRWADGAKSSHRETAPKKRDAWGSDDDAPPF